jgi:F0F1-type ATP synthase assembly protein I
VDLRERRQLTGGFGDALARAFELAVTPVLFGWVGHVVDGWAGTAPLFMAVLGVFAILGTLVKMWFRYVEDMKAQEAGTPWHRS